MQEADAIGPTGVAFVRQRCPTRMRKHEAKGDQLSSNSALSLSEISIMIGGCFWCQYDDEGDEK